MDVEIREATDSDLPQILELAIAAFGETEGPEITELISALLSDPTAHPLLSLVAVKEQMVVGHILFTKAQLEPEPSEPISASILAPLAVLPQYQKQGIGGQLIQTGLEKLKAIGVQLVFVLGHPSYYPRSGFAPAGIQGFEATYPIAPKNAEAWMVQVLQPDIIGRIQGRVVCADTLNNPKYWVE
ncbi:GCN5-related N-acetyltransferase [[Leptolyngbya] sp. PCC 7376]|nr:GCN5-related N-acetyltransferase [[Leptolyngbya] sp. PCC 7376]